MDTRTSNRDRRERPRGPAAGNCSRAASAGTSNDDSWRTGSSSCAFSVWISTAWRTNGNLASTCSAGYNRRTWRPWSNPPQRNHSGSMYGCNPMADNHRLLLVSRQAWAAAATTTTIYLSMPFPNCLPHPLDDGRKVRVSVEDRKIRRRLQSEAHDLSAGSRSLELVALKATLARFVCARIVRKVSPAINKLKKFQPWDSTRRNSVT